MNKFYNKTKKIISKAIVCSLCMQAVPMYKIQGNATVTSKNKQKSIVTHNKNIKKSDSSTFWKILAGSSILVNIGGAIAVYKLSDELLKWLNLSKNFTKNNDSNKNVEKYGYVDLGKYMLEQLKLKETNQNSILSAENFSQVLSDLKNSHVNNLDTPEITVNKSLLIIGCIICNPELTELLTEKELSGIIQVVSDDVWKQFTNYILKSQNKDFRNLKLLLDFSEFNKKLGTNLFDSMIIYLKDYIYVNMLAVSGRLESCKFPNSLGDCILKSQHLENFADLNSQNKNWISESSETFKTLMSIFNHSTLINYYNKSEKCYMTKRNETIELDLIIDERVEYKDSQTSPEDCIQIINNALNQLPKSNPIDVSNPFGGLFNFQFPPIGEFPSQNFQQTNQFDFGNPFGSFQIPPNFDSIKQSPVISSIEEQNIDSSSDGSED